MMDFIASLTPYIIVSMVVLLSVKITYDILKLTKD